MKYEKQPAFAVTREIAEMSNSIEGYPYGLTKLEYVSAHVLQGLCANSKLTQNSIDTVQIALNLAEMLLRKTEKP
jgi:hypothetical protein